MHKKITSKNVTGIIFWPVIFLYLLAAPSVLAQESAANVSEDNEANVLVSADEHATIYNIRRGKCSISWSIRKNEPHIIHHRAACGLPLKNQVVLLRKLAQSIYDAPEKKAGVQKLFWGTLDNAAASRDNELSFRLALAAAGSSAWNTKEGKPKKGGLYAFIKDLANTEMIYPELQEVFSPFDKNIRLVAIEKVRIMEANQLPYRNRLYGQGVKPHDRLPCDFMAWFSLTEKSKDTLK
jgi:hypothetical protein